LPDTPRIISLRAGIFSQALSRLLGTFNIPVILLPHNQPLRRKQDQR
jgi:hypothetical protein